MDSTVVKDLLNPSTPTVKKSTKVSELLKHIAEQGSGFFPVAEAGKLIGVVTERDLVKIVKVEVSANIPPTWSKKMISKLGDRTVESIMSTNPITIDQYADLDEALTLFGNHNIRFLPVIDKERNLLGTIRLLDIFKHYAGK